MMTTGEKWALGIILGLIGATLLYIIGVWQGWWRNIFGPAEERESDYDKCVTANKSKRDGEPCTNCIPEGSQMPNYSGVIQNGECIIARPKQTQETVSKVKITNSTGARTLAFQNGIFVSPQTANVIPNGTEIQITQMVEIQGHKYYNTVMGWIDGNDAQVVS